MFIAKIFQWFFRLSLWKKIGLFFVILIVIGISFSFTTSHKQTGYVFDTAKKTTINEVVSDSGKIISDGKVEVNSATNGIITDLYVESGQSVKEEQQLFKVKSSATVQEQQTAYANYQKAVADQNTAETMLHTYRSAMYTQWKTYLDLATNSTYESSKGVPNNQTREAAEFQTSQEDWLASEKQFKDQEQAVTAAQAQVNAAWTAYLATQTSVVTAPIKGIIANLNVSIGKSVTVPSALNPTAAPVLTIVNSPKVETLLTIGQTDIAKVRKGQRAKIHPDAYKNITYDGKVIQVDTLGNDTQGVVTYNIAISFDKNDDLLRPGMTVDGDIITNKQENVLSVPNSAIVLYKGGKAIRVLKNNTLTYIPVQVGIVGEDRTQILSGIAEGQQIIVALTNEKAARPGFLGL